MENMNLEDIKENIFHIRFLYYLMMNYGHKKVKSVYEITNHFKKGNQGEYDKAKKELIEKGYILDLQDEICLNPEKEQNKIFINGHNKDKSVTQKLRLYEKQYLEQLSKNKKFYEDEYKRYKEFKE